MSTPISPPERSASNATTGMCLRCQDASRYQRPVDAVGDRVVGFYPVGPLLSAV
jgi:hypothetical protein